jgi:hypothetical protein
MNIIKRLLKKIGINRKSNLHIEKFRERIDFLPKGDRVYSCPRCGFDPMSIDPANIIEPNLEHMGIFVLWGEDHMGYWWSYMIVKGRDGKIRSYPYATDFSGSYTDSDNPANWTEHHYCPFCKKPFEYWNGV